MIVFAFFASLSGALVLSGCIIAYALWRYRQLRAGYRAALRDFRAARERLDAVPGDGPGSLDFDSFSDWFLEHGRLGELWKQYRDTLVFSMDDVSPVRRSQSAESAFSSSRVLPLYVDLRLANSLPNTLTGLGILGTFVGLAVGIHLANSGLMANSLEEMRRSLSDLLGGASTAFLTSIAGLFSSILISVWTRRRDQEVAAACQAVSVHLDALLPSTSLELLATEIVQEARYQRQELSRFNSEFALAVAEALDERFAARLTPKLEELIASVEGLREERSVFNHDALAHLVERFEQTMRGAAGKEMQALASTVQEIGGALAGVKDALAAERDGINHALEAGLSTFQNGIRNLSTEISAAAIPIAEAANRWTATLREAEALLHRVVASARELESALKGGTSSIGHAAETLQRSTGEIQKAIDGLLELRDSLVRTGAELDEGSTALREGVKSLEELAQALRQHAVQLTRTWEEQRERFVGLDQELAKAFGHMSDGVHATTQRVGQLLGVMDNQLSEAVNQLGGTVKGLEDLLEEILDHLEALRTGERNGRA